VGSPSQSLGGRKTVVVVVVVAVAVAVVVSGYITLHYIMKFLTWPK